MVRYLPIVLSTGICPDNLDAFVRQQYRWCTGNAGMVFSRRLWSVPMQHPGPADLCFRLLLLRVHRAADLFGPAIPVMMLAFLPGADPVEELRHPAAVHADRVRALPAVAPASYGPSVWPLGIARGWAHVFAIWDGARGKSMSWHPTRTPGSSLRRFRVGDHRVERRHGAAVVRAGAWRTVSLGFAAVAVLLLFGAAQPRGGVPSDLPGGNVRMRSTACDGLRRS